MNQTNPNSIHSYEESMIHRSITEEYQFYHAVREGNLEYVRKNIESHSFENPDGMGILSKDPLQNLKYHFCITAAMLSRHCIEGGMEPEMAYRLSDQYIAKLDDLYDVKAVVMWHDKMLIDFTGKMNLQKIHPGISLCVKSAIDYIYEHIKEPITLEEIAANVALSPCYLSRLFMKETGSTIKNYILESKIERAQNMLKYSDSSSADIANFLSFSSQSHFIATFKKYTGMTPKKYKAQYARNIW